MTDFRAGQTVTVKAGMFRRKGGIMIPRHSRIELTDDDLKRSDLDLLVTADEAPEGASLTDPVEEPEGESTENDGVQETGLDLSTDLTVDQLRPILSKMTVADAKEFLANEAWTYDNMQVALEAEEAGKARETLTDHIESRLLDLDDDEG
jgi:hypothetical protein